MQPGTTVYVLTNVHREILYIGVTSDLSARIPEQYRLISFGWCRHNRYNNAYKLNGEKFPEHVNLKEKIYMTRDNSFQKLLDGGIVSREDMQELKVWQVVNRTIQLSATLNTSESVDQIRERLSEITGQQIDNSTRIFIPFYTNFGRHIRIGKNVFINHACTFLDLGGITIEDNVQLGPKVNLISENHPLNPLERKSFNLKPVLIKQNAWIGAAATILPGVTVGENAVVAAGAVVSKDVPANTIVGGVPAKFIKNI